jgi:hypothetical protein
MSSWSTAREHGRAKERVMAKRILMVITPRMAGDLRSVALSAAARARRRPGRRPIVTVRPNPPARVERYDRIIADEDQEMARLAAAAEEQMEALHLELGDVPAERVVRFGRLSAALRIEAQVFGADLLGLAAPGRPRLRHQLRAWYLARTLPVPVVLLPVGSDGADDRRAVTVVLSALR